MNINHSLNILRFFIPVVLLWGFNGHIQASEQDNEALIFDDYPLKEDLHLPDWFSLSFLGKTVHTANHCSKLTGVTRQSLNSPGKTLMLLPLMFVETVLSLTLKGKHGVRKTLLLISAQTSPPLCSFTMQRAS